MINVSDYDESLHSHDKKKQKMESRKAASEEVHLQTTANNRQRGCRRDVRRQIFKKKRHPFRKNLPLAIRKGSSLSDHGGAWPNLEWSDKTGRLNKN